MAATIDTAAIEALFAAAGGEGLDAAACADKLSHTPWLDPSLAENQLSVLSQSGFPSQSSAWLVDELCDSPAPAEVLELLVELIERKDRIPTPASREEARCLVALLAGSPYLSSILRRAPDLLDWLWREGGEEWGRQRMYADAPEIDDEYELGPLYDWHGRQLLRIGWADLAGALDIDTVTRELAGLADVIVERVARLWETVITRRHGEPLLADGSPAEWSIIGLGKAGGDELNFRSDIDVLFLYSAEGNSASTGQRDSLELFEWFQKWAERVLGTLTKVSPEGIFYRVDTRLRPDGRSGSLVRSLASYEHYYETRGEVWERQMLIKARPMAGSGALGESFIEMLKPFVYPASRERSPREEIRRVKNRILAHVQARGLAPAGTPPECNLKLRRGGLRDIEFIVQCLQLVVGGADRAIRSGTTLNAIEQMRSRGVLSAEESHTLSRCYRFYRMIEHRLQMYAGQATFDLPSSAKHRLILARQMGFGTSEAFLEELETVRDAVADIYDEVLGPAEAPDAETMLLEAEPGDQGAAAFLAERGFRDPEAAHRNLRDLAYGHDPVRAPSSPRPSVVRLTPRLLKELENHPDPDRGLANLEHVLHAFGAVESFADLLSSHAGFLDLLVTLCAGSQSFSDTLIRDPALLDWMVSSGVLRTKRTAEEVELVLRAAVAGLDNERRITRTIHIYRKRETLRIGLQYLLGIADCEQTADQLTAVADAVVRLLYTRVTRSVFARRGQPLRSDGAPAGFAVLALGKHGSGEMNFGSDLDLVFVYEEDGETDKGRDNVTTFTAVAQQLLGDLSDSKSFGALYEVDMRLRPEGRNGPLALSLGGYRPYLHHRAQTWERQALTRAYVVAAPPEGESDFRSRLLETVHDWVYAPVEPGIIDEIASMRTRMEDESKRKYGNRVNIKTAPGGLVDGEFVAQIGQLVYGGEDPGLRGESTLVILRRLGEASRLPQAIVSPLVSGHRMLQNVQMMLRIDDEHSRNVLPDDELARGSLAAGLGYASASALQDTLDSVMKETREAYETALELFRGALTTR